MQQALPHHPETRAPTIGRKAEETLAGRRSFAARAPLPHRLRASKGRRVRRRSRRVGRCRCRLPNRPLPRLAGAWRDGRPRPWRGRCLPPLFLVVATLAGPGALAHRLAGRHRRRGAPRRPCASSWPARPWFDTTLPRIGAPEPLLSHWSRLIDAAARPADRRAVAARRRRSGGARNAHRSGRRCCSSRWHVIVAREAQRRGGLLAAAFALFLVTTSAMALAQFRPGRIDHHNAQILCAVAGLIFLARSPADERAGWIAGALLGTGSRHRLRGHRAGRAGAGARSPRRLWCGRSTQPAPLRAAAGATARAARGLRPDGAAARAGSTSAATPSRSTSRCSPPTSRPACGRPAATGNARASGSPSSGSPSRLRRPVSMPRSSPRASPDRSARSMPRSGRSGSTM